VLTGPGAAGDADFEVEAAIATEGCPGGETPSGRRSPGIEGRNKFDCKPGAVGRAGGRVPKPAMPCRPGPMLGNPVPLSGGLPRPWRPGTPVGKPASTLGRRPGIMGSR